MCCFATVIDNFHRLLYREFFSKLALKFVCPFWRYLELIKNLANDFFVRMFFRSSMIVSSDNSFFNVSLWILCLFSREYVFRWKSWNENNEVPAYLRVFPVNKVSISEAVVKFGWFVHFKVTSSLLTMFILKCDAVDQFMVRITSIVAHFSMSSFLERLFYERFAVLIVCNCSFATAPFHWIHLFPHVVY